VTGRIKSLKNSSDSIGNQTRDLPACSAVPQPTVLPHTPVNSNSSNHFQDATWKDMEITETHTKFHMHFYPQSAVKHA
jgi:hypothetical protein